MAKNTTADRPDFTPQQEGGWVSSMHSYYIRTGLFRASDIQRVLGDPREGVEAQTKIETPLAAKASAK